MTVEPRLDIIGAALADQSRARILCELMDGRAFTNKELAAAANITAQTATAHLKLLGGAGLTSALRSGRFVYHRLANQEVAEALEALALLAPSDHLARARRPRSSCNDAAAFVARSCYNHIAGRLGVAITASLIKKGVLVEAEGSLILDPAQAGFFEPMGIALPQPGSATRPLVKRCLDWTERRPHISGPLGIAVMQRSLDAGWLERRKASRALTVTAAGLAAYGEHFGIEASDLSSN